MDPMGLWKFQEPWKKSDGPSIWNSKTNKHMKEWRLQPHKWCLLGHYPAWMCLDLTNFAILPLNSVPEKKYIFLHQKFHSRNARKTKYRANQHKSDSSDKSIRNPLQESLSLLPTQTGHYFSWKSFKITLCLHQVWSPQKKRSHSIIPVLSPDASRQRMMYFPCRSTKAFLDSSDSPNIFRVQVRLTYP